MKKLLSILLALLMLSFMLFACTKKDIQETSSNHLIGFFIDDESLEKIGISEERLKLLYELGEIRFFNGYAIFNNREGKNIVLQFNDSGEVIKVEAYDEVEATYENVEKIQQGMTVFEVIEILGLPFFYKTSSIVEAFEYMDCSVHVTFSEEMTVTYAGWGPRYDVEANSSTGIELR